MKKKRKKIYIVILIILLVLVITNIVLTEIIFPRKYKEYVEQAAKLYGVDPNLVYAIIKQESNFYEKALSKSNAKGLMQLMDTTAKEMAKDNDNINENNYDIYDPYTNIHLGTKYLAKLINYFDGNYYLAVSAYNAGMGRVSNWFLKPYTNYNNLECVIKNVEYFETRNYLEKVIRNYNLYIILY